MMADKVVALCPNDRVRHDAEPIASMYRNLGTASADQVVTRALTELAVTMAGITAELRRHELEDLARKLRRVQAMAINLGMTSFAQVAQDTRICLERSDATAFSAVWARLIRVAERSLSAERDLIGKTLV